jgi:hypothetical protein
MSNQGKEASDLDHVEPMLLVPLYKYTRMH